MESPGFFVTPPAPEQYAALVTAQAHRFPVKRTVTVKGDGGATVKLPLVIGNPSGACDMPPGEKAAPAWATSVSVTLGKRKGTTDTGRELTLDCVLWPAAAQLDEWIERWPGLPGRILDSVREKICSQLVQLRDPEFDEVPPAALASTLAHYPRAAWYRFAAPGEPLAVVIEAPESAKYEFFVAETNKPDARHWELTKQMAAAQVKAVAKSDGAPLATEEMIKRWPGTAVLAMQAVAVLAGSAAEVELGGW